MTGFTLCRRRPRVARRAHRATREAGQRRGTGRPRASSPRRPEPAGHRPRLHGDETLVTQELNPRVVLGVTPRRALERLHGGDLDRCGAQGVDEGLELAPGPVRCRGGAVSLQLVGRHVVRARAGHEAVRRQLDVAVADPGRDRRLVGRLVGAEARVAVGAEEAGLAEVACQLSEQRLHRSLHVPFVYVLVIVPVGPRVVRLEAFVEIQRALGPALEPRHRPIMLKLLSRPGGPPT